ncbi:hypothetical protein AYM40_34580 [Paraburkholderia phytofirmans OLGA172]|uniref:Uncharacterized protein n=1 Tax=Paraburkholderia phytofirmans OLGA172 TaxID=1417228 RepID=A0A160FV78_9BURK|nr:hypothetical protein AYM40_34580 [Paraburkholderia phytofirmans OLGA172]
MYQIEIRIVEPEPLKTCLERRFDTLGPTIGVPQFCGHEDVFARNPSGSKPYPQSLAHLALVPISFGTIEVTIAGSWTCNRHARSQTGLLIDQV